MTAEPQGLANYRRMQQPVTGSMAKCLFQSLPENRESGTVFYRLKTYVGSVNYNQTRSSGQLENSYVDWKQQLIGKTQTIGFGNDADA